MRGLQTREPGGLEHTVLSELAEPVCGHEQVVLAVRGVGLNPADRFQIEGRYPGGPRPPFTPGRDASGVVVQVGPGSDLQVGQAVLVLQSEETNLVHGTLAERVAVSAGNVVPLPAGWSFAEGAAAPLVYQTAWQALTCRGRPSPEQVVVVIGAAGGVGLAAMQLARGLGLRVIGLVRREEKRRWLLEHGFLEIERLDSPDLKERLRRLNAGAGVNLVVDTVGGRWLGEALHWLARDGVVAELGVLDDVTSPISLPSLLFKRATIQGILVSHATAAEARQQWQQITHILQQSGQRPVLDRVFPLAEFRAAFARLDTRPIGKVVIAVSEAGMSTSAD
ncbi:MAG: NADPH:quinone oxidoreductase [Planctomycetaceae bacterium]|nr:MAG: NADPH:quinone oxidoreductase [Planctomycetaceae bacterium]